MFIYLKKLTLLCCITVMVTGFTIHALGTSVNDRASLIITTAPVRDGFARGDGPDSSFYFTTSDSVKLYVRTAGTGNPCLFVHGGPGLTSYIFEATPAAKQLEQKMHMIYFDQRGSGRSSSAKDSITACIEWKRISRN